MQFFKVILASTIEAKKLEIPDAFTQYLNGYAKKVVLQNRIGLWHVMMSYDHKGAFFLNGWQQFVKDNHVEEGDFLVFKYDGDRKFDVIIFGKSAVEKRETSASVGIDIEVKMEQEAEEKTKNEAKADVNIEVSSDDDLGDPEYCGEDSEESEYNEAVEEEEMEDTEEEEEEEEARTNFICRGKKIYGDNGNRTTKQKYGKRARLRQGTLPAEEVRKYVQCQNPHFVSNLGSGQRKDLLFVPSYVLKDFDLKLPEHVTFRDELGRKWRGQVMRWKDGRTCIKGWRAVCRWNLVQNDDRCICEFLKRKERKTQHILVHIVRRVGSGSETGTEPNFQ